MKELQYRKPATLALDFGHGRRKAERVGCRLTQHGFQCIAGCKRSQHSQRKLGKGPGILQCLDVRRRQPLGDIQPAIRGEATAERG